VLGTDGKLDYLGRTTVILLQKVAPHIDKGARATVLGQLGNESFGLLDKALEGCRGGFAKAYCVCY
jgi:hypothetical protein